MSTAIPIVDCQTHVFPDAYADLLTRAQGGAVRATGGDGVFTLDYHAPNGEHLQRFALRVEDYSLKRKLADMNAAGVDVSVLSINLPTPDLLGPELAEEGARVANDAVAELCDRHPDRFVGLAVLPLPNIAAAIAELDRALDKLDMRGVFLPSHIAGMPLDDPSLEPFYAHVAARRVPLVLHPTVPTWGNTIRDYAMIPMLGFMVDTSVGMLRLILGGVLERHPTLQVVHPQAGGVLPYLMGRVEEQTEIKRRGRDHITRPPGSYYSQVYLDLVSPSALALDYAYKFAGPERLLFASDHPWVDIGLILETVRECNWPDEALAQILGGNACRLFDIQLS